MSNESTPDIHTAIERYVGWGRSGLLPALQSAQSVRGWLSEEVAAEIAERFRVPLADVHGVIEFYSMLYNRPAGKAIQRICTDQACALKGAENLLQRTCGMHAIKAGGITSDGALTIEASPCLGLCEHAPAALFTSTEGPKVIDMVTGTALARPVSNVHGTSRLLTKRCGQGTQGLAEYGEYGALLKARSMRPEEVVAMVKASGLVGRGGAAFPTGLKWEGAAAAGGDLKYVICNADESEPGTFKDRILLLDDPHQVIEGLAITAYAIGASRGYVYLRGEYPYIKPVLSAAIDEARGAGYLSADFDVEIRMGSGAYICGEETALFESIEGKRGFPRIKPPFPTTHGLFGMPTVINNVETLCNVPLILERGVEEYRRLGTEKSPGTKLFCVSGDVGRPGLYEVPFGTRLRDLLDLAGGVADGRPLKALLFGGAAGAFATAAQLDVPLTFEDLRAQGLPLGSGVLMAFDQTRDMRSVLKGLGHFFAHESCGKCYPCQIGTQRQFEILERLADGRTLSADLGRLEDVAWTMTDASLCGLGQTAASAVLSAIKLWPELFRGDHAESPVVGPDRPSNSPVPRA